jgi:MOSC domain-containing protein YiiM
MSTSVLTGTVVQINASNGGLPKLPVNFAEVHPLGIGGDDHRNKKYHGGPNKALLLISSEVVDQLRAEGWPVFYGALGENLTTRGLDHKAWRPGQQYRCGSVVFELTSPREPCANLLRFGRSFPRRIFENRVRLSDYTSPHWGMSGFYAAILRSGALRTLDIIECIKNVQ